MAGDSGKPGASEAASLVLRIATMGLSLASAIMTAASTQCVHGGATVSYSDYRSFKYSAMAELLSAVLQGVAIYLQVVKKEKAAKAVELIDKLLLALTSTSSALLFAVDDITSCDIGERRHSSRLCPKNGGFCGKIRASSFFSLAAVSSVALSVYTRHVSLGDILTPKALPPVLENPTIKPKAQPTTGTKHREKEKHSTKQPRLPPSLVTLPSPPSSSTPSPPLSPGKHPPPPPPPPPTQSCCGCPKPMIAHVCENPASSPRAIPRPSCGCMRLPIQHGCENHDRATITEPEEPREVNAGVPTGKHLSHMKHMSGQG